MPKLKREKLTIVASRVKQKPGKRAADSFYTEEECRRFAAKGNVGEINWIKVDWLMACTMPEPSGSWWAGSFATIYSNPVAGLLHRANADQAVARVLRALRPDVEWRAGIRFAALEVARWAMIAQTRGWERYIDPRKRAEVRAIAKAWREYPLSTLQSEQDGAELCLSVYSAARARARIPNDKPLPEKNQ